MEFIAGQRQGERDAFKKVDRKALPNDIQVKTAEVLGPLLLTVREAAALIGVSRATFWKLHSQGRVPLPLRLGGRVVRWRKGEVEAWVKAGCPARDKWQQFDVRPKIGRSAFGGSNANLQTDLPGPRRRTA
jgi:excisionase family DNA binding protein